MNGDNPPTEDDGEAPLSELPEGAACSACVFSRVTIPDPSSLRRARVCKRFPPVATFVPTAQGAGIITFDRVVKDSDYCYEFEAREGPEVIPALLSVVK